jgi:hypothetical protein
MARTLVITIAFIGLACWSWLGTFDVQMMHDVHNIDRATHQTEHQMENSAECAVALPLEAATSQTCSWSSPDASATGLALLALLAIVVSFLGQTSQHWTTPLLALRFQLHKLFDPLRRLLSSGIINPKKYILA